MRRLLLLAPVAALVAPAFSHADAAPVNLALTLTFSLSTTNP